MDLRRNSYYGQLQISGVADPINFEGSILEIHQASLQALQRLTARKDSTGHKKIALLIDVIPFSGSKAESDLLMANELAREIDVPPDDMAPLPNESQDDYCKRLQADELPQGTIQVLIDAYFGVPE